MQFQAVLLLLSVGLVLQLVAALSYVDSANDTTRVRPFGLLEETSSRRLGSIPTALNNVKTAWDKAEATRTKVVKREADPKYIRACYFTNWAQYRQGRGKYMPSEYIPGLCTHILYAFGWMNEDFTLRAFDPADETTSWSKGMYDQVNSLKKSDTQLKTLLSIGGWTFGTRLFQLMTQTAENRTTFIKSAISFVRSRNFDGLDIDWEYPTNAVDKSKHATLIKEIRLAFEDEAKETGKPRLLISGAVAAGKDNIDNGYNVPELAKSFDFVMVMAYDFHGSWETITGMNAPLYSSPSEPSGQRVLNVDWVANHWNKLGMPKEKIILGMATYGRGWTLNDPVKDNGIGAKTQGRPSLPTKFVQESGIGAYYEFCEMLANGAKRIWHSDYQTPYLISGNQWFGYDDEESIRIKVDYVKKNGFGGAFVWTLDFDDFNGKCSNGTGKRYPLISIIAEQLGGTLLLPSTVIPPSTTAAVKVSTTPATTGTTAKPTTTTSAPSLCVGKSDGFMSNPTDCTAFLLCLAGKDYKMACPQPLAFSSSLKYCVQTKDAACVTPTGTTTTARSISTTTASLTTSANADLFSCMADGFFRNPTDCTSFYRCVSSKPYSFSCPDGLNFNPVTLACDRPANVDCGSQ